MPLSDAINEVVSYESSGQDFCTAEKTSGIVAMKLARSDLPVGFVGVDGLDLTINTSKLGLGAFPTNVYIAEGTRAFASSDYSCTFTVLEYELENWTVTDYHRFAAQLTCPDPIYMIGGGTTVQLVIGPTQIEGYMLDE